MNTNLPYHFFRLFEKDRATFIYQGQFSDDLTDKTIRLGESSIRKSIDFNRIRKKVSFLIAECLQNIIRYEEKPQIVHQTNNRPGMFMVRSIKNSYYIVSSNLIKNEKVDILKSKLKKINELGSSELRSLQKKVLADPVFNPKGGAGLGLIEMSRKSGNKLEHDFEHVNFYLSSFYLQVKLATGRESKEKETVTVGSARPIFRDVLAQHVMLLYKGDCSQQSMLPVLSMIEGNLKKDTSHYNTRKKVFYLLVEMLQNMSKHALEKEKVRPGILIICRKGQNYYLYSGNLIGSGKVEELKTYLEKINGMDNKQLGSLYQENLLDGKVRLKGGAGLGLIDMARYSSSPLVYDFRKYDNKSSFYSFGLTI